MVGQAGRQADAYARARSGLFRYRLPPAVYRACVESRGAPGLWMRCRPSAAPLHINFPQADTKGWSTDGLQSALDDYRRACHDAERAVREQLRALALRLQARCGRGARAGPFDNLCGWAGGGAGSTGRPAAWPGAVAAVER